ncbi:hypothetical protein B0H16DRAFT_1577862 [Mycena metata]|uniref:Uncharacterized protein n=1 Tax=Mycena metata TaxID=1033252 RepID=A0AAD7MVT7_9AGAR|nr:hypothetical protein B0H16DRAFT_1577862 [Mycena metata]
MCNWSPPLGRRRGLWMAIPCMCLRPHLWGGPLACLINGAQAKSGGKTIVARARSAEDTHGKGRILRRLRIPTPLHDTT